MRSTYTERAQSRESIPTQHQKGEQNAMAKKTEQIRTRLNHGTIVKAALDLTARRSTGPLSLRMLGDELGVDPTAIYRHFRTMADVELAILDELAALSVADVSAPVEEWRTRLTELSEATLRHYTAHPTAAVKAATLTTHGPGERAAMELVLDAFTRAGLDEDSVVQFYAVFSQHILSSCAAISSANVLRGNGRVDSQWFSSPVVVDAQEYPKLTQLAPRLRALDTNALFETSTRLILDAAENRALAAASSTPR